MITNKTDELFETDFKWDGINIFLRFFRDLGPEHFYAMEEFCEANLKIGTKRNKESEGQEPGPSRKVI